MYWTNEYKEICNACLRGIVEMMITGGLPSQRSENKLLELELGVIDMRSCQHRVG